MSSQKKGPQRPEPTDEVSTLRRRLEEASAKITGLETQIDNQARCLEGCTDELERLRKNQPPIHVVRAFERGAQAERSRVLEQIRIELLAWPNGMTERRALESLRKALQDERLPLPAYTTGGA